MNNRKMKAFLAAAVCASVLLSNCGPKLIGCTSMAGCSPVTANTGRGNTGGSGAISFAQSTGKVSLAGGGGTTLTGTFASQPANGNTIIVSVVAADTVAISFIAGNVTDNKGNTYNLAIALTHVDGADRIAVAIYYANNISSSAGPHIVTAQVSGASATPEITMVATEYSGLNAAAPLDRISSAATVGGGVSPVSGTAGTTALTNFANELIVSVATEDAGTPSWVNNDASFTIRGTETDGTVHAPAQVVDKIVSATGTYSDSWTNTPSGVGGYDLTGVIATFHQ